MALLRRMIVVPLLAPLLVMLALGAANFRPAVTLRVLTWTSPPIPLGLWLIVAAGGGGLIGGLSTGLALRDKGLAPPARRQVSRTVWPAEKPEPQGPPGWGAEPPANQPAAASTAGPSRSPGEPAPTVEVPFRVIRTPKAPSGPSPDDDWGVPDGDDW